MCTQCVSAAASGAVAGVTGARAWLGTRNWSFLTRNRLRLLTGALIVCGLLVAGTLSGGGTAAAGGTSAPAAQGASR